MSKKTYGPLEFLSSQGWVIEVNGERVRGSGDEISDHAKVMIGHMTEMMRVQACGRIIEMKRAGVYEIWLGDLVAEYFRGIICQAEVEDKVRSGKNRRDAGRVLSIIEYGA